MSNLGNFLAYQAVWFAVVASAGRGRALLGIGAAAIFIVAQLAISDHRRWDAELMGAALALGLSIDGGLEALGWLRYASATPALPPGGAPLWILALWLSFALTVTRSMSWIMRRPPVAILAGAIGAPLAYLGAARGWHAAEFAAPSTRGIAALAFGWALAMALLSLLARRKPASPGSAAPLEASA